MAYSQKVIDDVMNTPKSLGNQLGRWAIHYDLPAAKLAKALGVSRQTVYNWFAGKYEPGNLFTGAITEYLKRAR